VLRSVMRTENQFWLSSRSPRPRSSDHERTAMEHCQKYRENKLSTI
jgi:hypothetical protein